jgi:hypothetical protein
VEILNSKQTKEGTIYLFAGGLKKFNFKALFVGKNTEDKIHKTKNIGGRVKFIDL